MEKLILKKSDKNLEFKINLNLLSLRSKSIAVNPKITRATFVLSIGDYKNKSKTQHTTRYINQ